VPERYTITGADTVASTLRLAGRNLRDLSGANQDAAQIFAGLARARAPRVTGALANATQAVATKTTAGVENVLPYFGPIHYGWPYRNIEAQPFVDDAVEESRAQWFAVYEHAAQEAADSVRGA
jgi:hypothetical protein